MCEASRRGMTLVELLVVLAILAGLAVAVGANVTAVRERERAERTERDGRAMAVRAETSDRAAVTRLHVFVWQPEFTVPETGDPAVALACRYYAAANADSLTATEGLTHGLRAVYVCASTATGALAAPPQYLLLRPGVNALSLTLHPVTAYPTAP